MRTTYIFRDGKMINKDDYVPEPSKRGDFATPMLKAPFEPYTSPIDGRPVMNMAQRREDLKRNDCIEWEPGIRQDVSKNTIHKRNPEWSNKHNRPMKNGKVIR